MAIYKENNEPERGAARIPALNSHLFYNTLHDS
ncbi:hypothetical protein CHRY9393_03565 [Chryseobacterium fistulae]|uniref:Uncharacterized protein n=1 Tax=Chryseobacterium fistulae TaxID=2675058 RepID=A0A6N4XVE5_9FLAO|nr:hypothetical protein CHRY9393_03565 [Chryseobacterium fistulae]